MTVQQYLSLSLNSNVMGFGEATHGNAGFTEYQESNTLMSVQEKLPNCFKLID